MPYAFSCNPVWIPTLRDYGLDVIICRRKEGKTEVVKVLVRAKAKVDLEVNVKVGPVADITPLRTATDKNHFDIVGILLAAGANA